MRADNPVNNSLVVANGATGAILWQAALGASVASPALAEARRHDGPSNGLVLVVVRDGCCSWWLFVVVVRGGCGSWLWLFVVVVCGLLFVVVVCGCGSWFVAALFVFVVRGLLFMAVLTVWFAAVWLVAVLFVAAVPCLSFVCVCARLRPDAPGCHCAWWLDGCCALHGCCEWLPCVRLCAVTPAGGYAWAWVCVGVHLCEVALVC
jgi:hypothetical protein